MTTRITCKTGLSLLAAVLLLALAAGAAPQADSGKEKQPKSDFFVKKGTWPETMFASRACFLNKGEEFDVTCGPWFATAPQAAKAFIDTAFPEEGVDLEASDAQGKKLWKKRGKYIDGIPHGLPLKDRAATYLYRTITAREAVTLSASLGSDDGLEVWLNGKKILSRDVARGLGRNQDRVDLELKAGENAFLFKVYNISGGHGFYFNLKEDPLLALWNDVKRFFPREALWMERDLPSGGQYEWFRPDESDKAEGKMIKSLLEDLGDAGKIVALRLEACPKPEAGAPSAERLSAYANGCRIRDAIARIERADTAALRRAIEDLIATYPERYKQGKSFLARLDEIEKIFCGLDDIGAPLLAQTAEQHADAFEKLRAEALLANPLVDFDRILLVKRKANSPKLGLPQNWQGNCSLPRSGFDDELATLTLADPAAGPATLFKPKKPAFIGDVDLHFGGDRMLFSSIGSHNRWQIFEVDAGGKAVRQVTPGLYDDVDNYDACYLPDGRIIFDSTRCFQGIPCVGGNDQVANLYIMDSDGGGVRQLCFDQDHDWCPTVLNNGRVLFTRWEYSDTPHYFSRLLFHMNPDGTGQMEYYGSNSFWPNSLFYARPIPEHPTRFVAIVSGHHGVPRMGELVLFDPARGRREADGVIQRIPGFGKKVEPVIVDQLVNNSWPRFLHPYPLSGKLFLVSCKPSPDRPWGIYLADIFDNLICLCEEPGFALVEPIPLKATKVPPVIPDRVRTDTSDAVIYLSDVYQGNGLDSVPRGTVKKLRVFEFHYAYNNMGGHAHIGVEGPWDVHRIMGTVPVLEDGSGAFVVPANTPIAVQPLDEQGRAVQVMRSWFTAMPGEALSCVGCHESQNQGPPSRMSQAALRTPSAIEPWYGPTRGFSFKREVQPVLDKFCVGCHNGEPRRDGRSIPDLSAKEKNGWGNFTPSYLALHPYVRRPGPESDYRLQRPLEFHASTSELVQMLTKGHHGVTLDDEGWDRLVTWIDLNVPDHGTWAEQAAIPRNLHKRRLEMRALYAGRPEDPEAIPEIERQPVEFVKPRPESRVAPLPEEIRCAGWPFGGEEAKRRQSAGAGSLPLTKRVDLGGGISMDFVLVPAGEFLMGDPDGCRDEIPCAPVAIEKPFYIGKTEVTLKQFACFDSEHHNGFLDQRHKDHTTPGYPVHKPSMPVIRVSWDQAMAYCRWLESVTGQACSLPTEAEWEWACRAGAETAFHYGTAETDFAPFANLADASTSRLAVTGVNPHPIANPNQYQDYLPKEARFDDGERLMAEAGKYQPNAWGLNDMHGNVWEWTLSSYRSYPYRADDGRNDGVTRDDKVVRGGSWRDRPIRARAGFRLAYRPYQRVFNVGFRIVLPAEE